MNNPAQNYYPSQNNQFQDRPYDGSQPHGGMNLPSQNPYSNSHGNHSNPQLHNQYGNNGNSNALQYNDPQSYYGTHQNGNYNIPTEASHSKNNPNKQNNVDNTLKMTKNVQAMMMNEMRNKRAGSDDEFEPADFSDKKLRLNFIKKTFAILSIQLFITCIVCIIPLVNESVRLFMIKHWYLVIVSAVISMIIMYTVIYTNH